MKKEEGRRRRCSERSSLFRIGTRTYVCSMSFRSHTHTFGVKYPFTKMLHHNPHTTHIRIQSTFAIICLFPPHTHSAPNTQTYAASNTRSPRWPLR
jgi:hypothetical protein